MDTSAKSFHEVEQSGLLGKLQLIIYRQIDVGPKTTGEIAALLPDYRLNSISPRLAELARMNVIATTGERKCSITGKTALVWDKTNSVPVTKGRGKPKNRLQLLRKELAEARAEIIRLETIVERQQAQLKQWGRPTKETIAARPADATLMLPL